MKAIALMNPLDASSVRKDSPADALLVELAAGGDNDAFAHLVRRHEARVTRVVAGFLKDRRDVDEVTADVFVQAWRNLDRYRGEATLTTWLHRIAVNSSLARSRRRAVEVVPLVDAAIPAGYGAAADDAVTLTMTVHAAVATLPDHYRAVVVLRDLEGYTTDEVARMLGIHPRNVKSRLHRGRRMLQRILHPR